MLSAFWLALRDKPTLPSPRSVILSLIEALADIKLSCSQQSQWEATERILATTATPSSTEKTARADRKKKSKAKPTPTSAATTTGPLATPGKPPQGGRAKAPAAASSAPPAAPLGARTSATTAPSRGPDPYANDCLNDIRHTLVTTSPACAGGCNRTHLAQRTLPVDRKSILTRFQRMKSCISSPRLAIDLEAALRDTNHPHAARFSGTL